MACVRNGYYLRQLIVRIDLCSCSVENKREITVSGVIKILLKHFNLDASERLTCLEIPGGEQSMAGGTLLMGC